ncbi:hypothetical protein BHU72_08650 [Desulfuribacillus stibiiarsenatis]|uniref:YetF C-terminal domain-containing protein n=1 Tax=Desulfuribacillus stibiiarsenatis TaxID=1390249 RepID=A0A1E5L390_9FIRM|nr:DUF421 domain-containing protein [Desulfuribacillus stibiiarsenatis]OEH84567.1 hypothetical protein BHU72_08650 [Desulfuribacillus stibiiarsenatis]
MEELITSLSRTLFIYFFILVVMRVMGKRELAKLSIFDLVVFIMIAELAAVAIEDVSKPLLQMLSPIILVMALQIVISYVSLKQISFRNMIEGKPVMIIENGKINDKEMQKQRYDINDLLLQLHEQKVKNVGDVEFAILETSGKLTVFTKESNSKQSDNSNGKNNNSKKQEDAKEAQEDKYIQAIEIGDYVQDQKFQTSLQTDIRFLGLPLTLISDTRVQDDNLEKIQQTRFWLKNMIQEAGFKEFKDIYYMSIDEDGKIYIDAREYDT